MSNNNRRGGNSNGTASKPAAPTTPPAEVVAETLLASVPTPPPAAAVDEFGNPVTVPTPPPAEVKPAAPVPGPLAKLAAVAPKEKPKGKTLADLVANVGRAAGKNEYPVQFSTGKTVSVASLLRWYGRAKWETAAGSSVQLSRSQAVACLVALAGNPDRPNPKLLELSENTVKTQFSNGRSGSGDVPTLTEQEQTEALCGL